MLHLRHGLQKIIREELLGVVKNLSGKVNFVLTNPPYSVQMDQEDDLAEYYVLGLNDKKDLAKVLGDVMNPRAHEQVFSCTLKIALEYKAVVFERRASQYQGRFCRSWV